MKIAIELGVAPDRINTIIDFAAAKQYGVKTDGSQAALNAASATHTDLLWLTSTSRPSRTIRAIS